MLKVPSNNTNTNTTNNFHCRLNFVKSNKCVDNSVNEKVNMDDYDSASNPLEIPGYVPVELILQHSQYGTFSMFRVEFPLTTKVSILKQDMEKRLKIPPERQEWFYKGVIMQPYDTMLHRRVKVDDKIVVKENTASRH